MAEVEPSNGLKPFIAFHRSAALSECGDGQELLAFDYRLADQVGKLQIRASKVEVGQLAREPAKPISDIGPLRRTPERV
jgi:hypothetical protein